MVAERSPLASPEVLAAVLADDRHPLEDRLAAARSMVLLGTEPALDAWLVAIMAEADSDKRAALLATLEGLDGSAGATWLVSVLGRVSDPQVVDTVEDHLSRLCTPQEAVQLAGLYKSLQNTEQAAAVLQVVSGLENPLVLPELAGWLVSGDTPTPLFLAAATALGKSGTRAGVLGLLDAWPHARDDAGKQSKILEMLEAARDDEAKDALRAAALESQYPEIRAAAERALNRAD